jgi:hypothetical protein
MICYACGGKGHAAKACPSQKGKSKGKGKDGGKGKGEGWHDNYPQQSKGKGKEGGGKGMVKGGGKGGFQGECYRCGRYGHSIRDCRVKLATVEDYGKIEEVGSIFEVCQIQEPMKVKVKNFSGWNPFQPLFEDNDGVDDDSSTEGITTSTWPSLATSSRSSVGAKHKRNEKTAMTAKRNEKTAVTAKRNEQTAMTATREKNNIFDVCAVSEVSRSRVGRNEKYEYGNEKGKIETVCVRVCACV